MPESPDDRLRARADLAWAIAVGGIAAVIFAVLVLFTWYFAATLFLIFGGILLGVALNALTGMLGQVLHVAGSLAVDRYQGTERVQLRVLDVAVPDPGPAVIR